MFVKNAGASTCSIVESEHLIGKFVGSSSGGATLIVVGSLHGNELGGVIALKEVARKLENLRPVLHGRVYFLAGNTRALQRGVRFVEADLNRHWTSGNLSKHTPQIAEDFEQRELLQIFEEILATVDSGEVYALDLHSTSAIGRPFATVGDTLRNRRFARKFPVTILLGIEEQLDGTMLEYLNNRGAVTFGFEGGQHTSPATLANHEALVWLALINSGILSEKDAPGLEKQRENLAKAAGKAQIFEIRHRETVGPEDDFEMYPGFENFDSIKQGQILARNRRGEIGAVESGLILMPLYQKQGEDGFFIGREVAPVWLKLSAFLRKLKIGNLMPFLPGVRRHPADPDVFFVNTRIARFFPLQIFHLLGFRNIRQNGNELVVSRRRHDTTSPFEIERRYQLWANKKLRLNKTKTV